MTQEEMLKRLQEAYPESGFELDGLPDIEGVARSIVLPEEISLTEAVEHLDAGGERYSLEVHAYGEERRLLLVHRISPERVAECVAEAWMRSKDTWREERLRRGIRDLGLEELSTGTSTVSREAEVAARLLLDEVELPVGALCEDIAEHLVWESFTREDIRTAARGLTK